MNKQRVQCISLVMALTLVLAACSASGVPSDETDVGVDRDTGDTTTQIDAPSNADDSSGEATDSPETEASESVGSFDRDSFVMCPVIEEYDVELASILGFDVAPEGSGQPFPSECFIRGANSSDLASVKLVGNFVPSIDFYVEGYEGVRLPAPELGDGAVFIGDGFQPRVVFPLGDLIIDVGANVEGDSLTQDVMIAYALRVKELLVEANG